MGCALQQENFPFCELPHLATWKSGLSLREQCHQEISQCFCAVWQKHHNDFSQAAFRADVLICPKLITLDPAATDLASIIISCALKNVKTKMLFHSSIVNIMQSLWSQALLSDLSTNFSPAIDPGMISDSPNAGFPLLPKKSPQFFSHVLSPALFQSFAH